MTKKRKWDSEIATYNFMMVPAIILLFIFSIIPMFGIVIAFENYVPAKGIFGSKWAGLDYFELMLMMPDSKQIFLNTITISIWKIAMNIVVPVAFALMLNEVRIKALKKTVQTIVIMPHFLSWVILGNIFVTMLSLDGLVNNAITALGGEGIMFLGSNTWFQPVVIITATWKDFGYSAIIYLSALTSIDPNLYEAASIDGASHWKQITRITLPLLVPTIILMLTLALGGVLNAGFDQIFNLYNPSVYKSGDIIDTYVYRMGLVDFQYSLSTAVGLMKSVISFILIISSNCLAKKISGYSMF